MKLRQANLLGRKLGKLRVVIPFDKDAWKVEELQDLLWLTPWLLSLGVPEAGVMEALELDSPTVKSCFLPWLSLGPWAGYLALQSLFPHL